MTEQTLAYKEVTTFLDVLFHEHFENRWASGFIHFVWDGQQHGHRSFVRYRSGTGEWVNLNIEQIIPALKILLTAQPGINAVRASVFVNDPNTIQYLHDVELLSPQVKPLIIGVDQPFDTTEAKVLAAIYDFMSRRKLPGFRYCAFEFFRFNSSIATLVRYVNLKGESYRIEIEIAPALEILVYKYWWEQAKYDCHLLRICFDHSFAFGIEFEEYYILRELEIRENGDFSLRDGII